MKESKLVLRIDVHWLQHGHLSIKEELITSFDLLS